MLTADNAALDELRGLVGGEHVLIDSEVTANHCRDWTGRFRGSTPAVVRPGTREQVKQVVVWARRHGVGLVPQGGNTGLVGGSVPRQHEVVVSLRRLDDLELDPLERQVTAGAGATLGEVQRLALRHGLRYPVDLAARDSATIGGTVATNAGGINFVRFGDTRAHLVGLSAVLGTGAVVDDLRRLQKDNTGYHLPSLLCGSEGTLAIITDVRLRLVRQPAHQVAALVGFDSVAEAISQGTAWAGVPMIEALELMTADGVALVCEQLSISRPPLAWRAAYLLVEAAGERDVHHSLAGLVGDRDSAVADDVRGRAALWRYRDEHTTAINRLGPPHKFDVTLPARQLSTFVDHVAEVVRELDPNAATWLFGHVGDGNIHVNVTGCEHPLLDRSVLRYVASLGGSISAEHGIGVAKASYLALRHDEATIAAMRAVKSAFDPDDIMNPGVILPRVDEL
jgi:FAD/FMN-containing dehydrogenase